MPAGRPPKYLPIFARQAAKLCRKGATRFELARHFEVDTVTIWRWEHAYPEFCNALKLPIDKADQRVERSLYERANGYSFESEKIFCNKDGDVTRVAIIEHVPPDPTSMIFWLKNRKPAEWRDRHDFDVEGNVTYVFDDPTQRPAGYQRKRARPQAA